jgi:AcrR family transcriptional regulator
LYPVAAEYRSGRVAAVSTELRTDARINHERIVETATEAFAERGLGVEMKEIADRAGVAVGTIYRHFPSKEDLLTAIARSLIADAVANADLCAALPEPIEALTALLTGNLRRGKRYGWLIAALLGAKLPHHQLEQLRDEKVHQHFRTVFVSVIERAIAQGALRPDLDTGIAVAMLEGATMPWAYAVIAGGREPEALARDIMATFLRGAGAAASESGWHKDGNGAEKPC